MYCTTVETAPFVATVEGTQSNELTTDLTTINVKEGLAFLSKKRLLASAAC